MFNILIVLIDIKQGSAVLFESFLANLWSNQSPYWLRRCPVYNLFGAFSTDPIAGTRAPRRLEERISTHRSTRLAPLDRKYPFKNNNQCLSIAIIRKSKLLASISTMKNIDRRWITFIRREITRRLAGSFRCPGISSAKVLRPKI